MEEVGKSNSDVSIKQEVIDDRYGLIFLKQEVIDSDDDDESKCFIKEMVEISMPTGSKNRRGVVLKSQTREMIVKVREFFEKEKQNGGPLISFDQVVDRTAAAFGISRKTVSRISKEKNKVANDEKLLTPGKKRPRKSLTFDASQVDAIRRHIYSYYERKEYPNKKRLLFTLKEAGLFSGGMTSLYYTLKKVGFAWKKIEGNKKLLMERSDIVAWRARFLRDILSVPMEQIIWLDETWVNSGHSKSHIWTEDTVKGTMNAPVGKGTGLILLHAGGVEGFVPNGQLLFVCKKNSKDYHNEMNHLTFTEWFKEQLIPNLKPGRVIVMDNAPYHCVQREKIPTMSQRKDDIILWLTVRGIEFDRSMYKEELMEIVKIHKPRFPIYEIDEIAKEHGHRVIRIPPYHCHFNPIEMIWAQIKRHVASNNKNYKMSEVLQLTEEKINTISSEDWQKVVSHTEEVIKDQAHLDGIVQQAVEEMIISISSSSSSSSEWEESDFSDDQHPGTEEMEL